MNVEIIGVWPFNKGAVLMLQAIKARLGAEFPHVRFAVPLSWPAEARLALGLWGTPARDSQWPSVKTGIDMAPVALRRRVGILSGREIDLLLDASGFGYGDFWGLPQLKERLAQRLAIWKNPRNKAVLLPQALGPFEGPGMADAFRTAMDYLDLAFVRDEVSHRYVTAVLRLGQEAKLRRAPDFTNLLRPSLPGRLSELEGQSAVIPNEKLVSGQTQNTRANYIRFLATAISQLRTSGHEPFILVHEGQLDREIAMEVNASLQQKVRVVEEPSSLVTKSVIAVAKVVISSRFHGLVSALSSGVPALACGWSHKYAELMSDYGCPEAVVDFHKPETWLSKMEEFLSSAAQTGFRSGIMERASIEKAKSERMWEEVINLVRSSTGSP